MIKKFIASLSGRVKLITAATVVLLITGAVILLVCLKGGGGLFSSGVRLTVETPAKIDVLNKAPFTLDVTLSALGDVLYPAASVSISFDSSRLEFLGIEEGNIMTRCDAHEDGGIYQLPEWSVNALHCNEIGQINAMYLDMSGGRCAFSKGGMPEDDGVLMRLSFRLRGSAAAGDIYELDIVDAVIAASDEAQSLASVNGTLITANGRIVVGD